MKKTYTSPKAIDLSGLGVLGYEPLGVCATGSEPTTFTCADGSEPTQPYSCTPTGYSATSGDCKSGGQVANVCAIGSLHA